MHLIDDLLFFIIDQCTHRSRTTMRQVCKRFASIVKPFNLKRELHQRLIQSCQSLCELRQKMRQKHGSDLNFDFTPLFGSKTTITIQMHWSNKYKSRPIVFDPILGTFFILWKTHVYAVDQIVESSGVYVYPRHNKRQIIFFTEKIGWIKHKKFRFISERMTMVSQTQSFVNQFIKDFVNGL